MKIKKVKWLIMFIAALIVVIAAFAGCSNREFEQYKQAAKTELKAYAVAGDYSAENWVLVKSAVTTGLAAVDAATSEITVDTAVVEAKAAIDVVAKEEEVIIGKLYNLQESYDEGYITREDLMHIAYFVSNTVLNEQFEEIEFTPIIEKPMLLDIPLNLVYKIKAAFYDENRDVFIRHNADVDNITIYFYGEYSGVFAVQVKMDFVGYGLGSFIEQVADIAWMQFGPKIVIFVID